MKFLTTFIISLLMAVSLEAAAIRGTVIYDGPVPETKQADMSMDPACAKMHDEPVMLEHLIVGESKELANSFIQIKSGLGESDYPSPKKPVILDQAGCQYSPRVFGVRVGQEIRILNPDDTFHNVHARTKVNKGFNIAMPKFRKEMTKQFDQAEAIFPITCDVHPWMKSWCAVMTHPYFGVSEKNGTYVINNVPPGTYEVEAWHEQLGRVTKTVTVDKSDVTLDFIFLKP